MKVRIEWALVADYEVDQDAGQVQAQMLQLDISGVPVTDISQFDDRTLTKALQLAAARTWIAHAERAAKEHQDKANAQNTTARA